MVAVGKDNGRAVARGDDFCALLGVAQGAEGAEGVAARAAERLAAGRYSVGGLAVARVAASVRVAVGAPSRGATAEGRLRQADRVMETDPDVVVVMVLRREDGSSVAASAPWARPRGPSAAPESPGPAGPDRKGA